jgi:hypothetical protein
MKKYRIGWISRETGKTGYGDWYDNKPKLEKEMRRLEYLDRKNSYFIEEKNVFWRNFWRKYRKFLPTRLEERIYIYYLTKKKRCQLGLASMISKCPHCFKKDVLVDLPSGRTGCVACNIIAKLASF